MMYALNVNFVRTRRPVSWLALAALAAGLAAMAVMLVDHVEARDELALADARLEQVQRRQQQAQVVQRRGIPAAQAVVEAPVVRNILAQLHMPWNAMLRALENLADPSVALLSLESQAKGQSLRLTGEARSMTDVLAYVSRLDAAPGIGAATLSGHEERLAGAVRMVRFSVDVTWKPQS